MLADIPLSLFHEWMEFAELEPLGGAVWDYHLARLTCCLANAHRDRRKHRSPFQVKDFQMSRRMRAVVPQTADQMKTVLRTFTQAYNVANKGRTRG